VPPSAAPTPAKATAVATDEASVAATDNASTVPQMPGTPGSVTTVATGLNTVADTVMTTASEAAAVGKGEPVSKPKSPIAETELSGKLNKVGVLNQLMRGYSQLRTMVAADSVTQAYLKDLEGNAQLPPLGSEVVPYTGDETYIEHPTGTIRPIKDTINAVLHAVHALVYGLNQQLANPRISFMDFKAGDIALFLPAAAENRRVWMAYHASTPSRYLSEVRRLCGSCE
jgi:hypothetical protein